MSSHHYARRRLKYTEILQHDVSKTGREKTGFIFHILKSANMKYISDSNTVSERLHERHEVDIVNSD